jgi:hypothetical protein
VVADAESGEFLVCAVVPVFELGSHRVFAVVGGWFSSRFGCVGVSNPPPSPNGEVGTSQIRQKPQRGGINIILLKERRKTRNN